MTDIITFIKEILPYEEYNHAYDVGFRCKTKGKAYAVALLHDIVEDGYATFEELQQSFDLDAEQMDALEAITRRNGERYFDYIQRVKQNKIAKIVKLADLKHNINRCSNDLPNRYGLLRRYVKAYGILIDELVPKQLSLPTTIPLQKNIEPFKQFSLLKHVDMVVGINKTDEE